MAFRNALFLARSTTLRCAANSTGSVGSSSWYIASHSSPVVLTGTLTSSQVALTMTTAVINTKFDRAIFRIISITAGAGSSAFIANATTTAVVGALHLLASLTEEKSAITRAGPGGCVARAPPSAIIGALIQGAVLPQVVFIARTYTSVIITGSSLAPTAVGWTC